ncbi:MAG: hypothetical protein GWP91_15140 [Rhodobacterales bacterium]|nr:hypothetical protein [Rhodobacterales bacterium]
MSKLIRHLARHTLLEAREDRIPHVVSTFAIACITLLPVVRHLTMGAGSRGVQDVGLALQWLAVCAVGLWLGLRTVGLDLDHGRAALLLVRPISPAYWLAGRAVGVGVTLMLLVVGLLAVWLPVAWYFGATLQPVLLAWATLIWLEGALLATLAALISTRTRPLFAALVTLTIWVSGHLSSQYQAVMDELGLGVMAKLLYLVLPDFQVFDLQANVIGGLGASPTALIIAIGYGCAWLVALGALTVWSVQQRDHA